MSTSLDQSKPRIMRSAHLDRRVLRLDGLLQIGKIRFIKIEEVKVLGAWDRPLLGDPHHHQRVDTQTFTCVEKSCCSANRGLWSLLPRFRHREEVLVPNSLQRANSRNDAYFSLQLPSPRCFELRLDLFNPGQCILVVLLRARRLRPSIVVARHLRNLRKLVCGRWLARMVKMRGWGSLGYEIEVSGYVEYR